MTRSAWMHHQSVALWEQRTVVIVSSLTFSYQKHNNWGCNNRDVSWLKLYDFCLGGSVSAAVQLCHVQLELIQLWHEKWLNFSWICSTKSQDKHNIFVLRCPADLLSDFYYSHTFSKLNKAVVREFISHCGLFWPDSHSFFLPTSGPFHKAVLDGSHRKAQGCGCVLLCRGGEVTLTYGTVAKPTS